MQELLSITQKSQPAIYLEIIKQTSVEEQKLTKNGQTQRVHVVVKNSPFQLGCVLRNGRVPVNFNFLTFEIKLIYDLENEEEVILAQGCEPMEYKPTISENGLQIDFDVKIKVLSSHLNNLNFRLKIRVWDPSNGSFPQLIATSAPIRVISKPLKHRKRGNQVVPRATSKRGRAVSPPSVVVAQQGDLVHEAVKRIEKNQTEHIHLLKQLVSSMAQSNFISNKIELPNGKRNLFCGLEDQPLFKKPKKEGQETPYSSESLPKDFEDSFNQMLRSYSQMSNEARVDSVRNAIKKLSSRDSELAFEMIDLILIHGLRKESNKPLYGSVLPIPQHLVHPSNCGCGACQTPLLAPAVLDDFFSEFLF